jgi:hypothetical protein
VIVQARIVVGGSDGIVVFSDAMSVDSEQKTYIEVKTDVLYGLFQSGSFRDDDFRAPAELMV